jgi:hypothetical protein
MGIFLSLQNGPLGIWRRAGFKDRDAIDRNKKT